MISIQTSLLRLGLALLLGACVGFERERGDRAAGLRTHALVALGACLVMIVSAFGFGDVLGVRNVTLDPSRVAAQVVSGIGFLGAGAILLRKEIVKGLTTAAAIWVVAAIGLACGAGMLLEAIFTTIFTIAVLTLLQPLRRRIRRLPEVHQLRIKVTAEESLLSRVYDICMEAGATLEQVEVQAGNGHARMEIMCATGEASRLTKSLVALRTAPGMETIAINLHSPANDLALFPLFAEVQTTISMPQ
ncbi:MAG TPA: MgtC/SapB family protein [Ktedonosporobacter sp.]|jgi:putative Mg2+ transporter-C (MgtC) family protein|nr:MgtC/SapB family protein [Ktedonosporobacter sp.]